MKSVNSSQLTFSFGYCFKSVCLMLVLLKYWLEQKSNLTTNDRRYGVICVPISDPRSGVDISINRETISLEDLNAAGTATSVLLTTFDLPLPDDVGMVQG